MADEFAQFKRQATAGDEFQQYKKPSGATATPTPMAEAYAHPGGVKQWLTDLESDLRYGGSQTVVGRGLKKMGYQAPESLGGEGGNAGRMIVSPLTGTTYAAHGVAEAASGHPIRGAGQVLSGIGEASEIPMQFVAPETAEITANTAARIADSPANQALGKGALASARVAARELPKVAIKHIPYIGKVATDLGNKASAAYREAASAAPSVTEAAGLPEVEAARPAAEAHLRNVIGTKPTPDALGTIPPTAARQSDVLATLPQESEGLRQVEIARPQAESFLRKVIGPTQQPDISRSNVGELLNQGLGGKALAPKVPIKSQLENVTPVVPKESSVVESHTYNPEAQELRVKTKNGGEYIHGDVTPEQAQKFAAAESKGKAWNELRNNSTLVAKVVNGKRIPMKPSGPRIATPNDLTPVLEESVKQARAKKASE